MVTLIAQLYALVGLISIIGYSPQIMKLLKGAHASEDISIKTWTIWFFENSVAMAYGVFCLQDFIFCFITALDLVCMGAIVCLVIQNRFVRYGHCKNFVQAFIQYYFIYPFCSAKNATLTQAFLRTRIADKLITTRHRCLAGRRPNRQVLR
jgi:hypothetical protein